MTELSEKAKTNHRWTSNDAYKKAYDVIFAEKAKAIEAPAKTKWYRRKWVYIRVANDFFEDRNPLWKTSKAEFDAFYKVKENEYLGSQPLYSCIWEEKEI